MNLRLTGTTFLLLSALALMAYGFADYLNAALGAAKGQATLLNNFWPMEAIALGASIILGFAYPQLRGVRMGDPLVAIVPSRQVVGPAQMDFFSTVPVTALEDGRIEQQDQGASRPLAPGRGRGYLVRGHTFPGHFEAY